MLLTLAQLENLFQILTSREDNIKRSNILNKVRDIISGTKILLMNDAERKASYEDPNFQKSCNSFFNATDEERAAVKAAALVRLKDSEDYQELLLMEKVVDQIQHLLNAPDKSIAQLQNELIKLLSELKVFLEACLNRHDVTIGMFHSHGVSTRYERDLLDLACKKFESSNSMLQRIKFLITINNTPKELKESDVSKVVDEFNHANYRHMIQPAFTELKSRFN